MTDFVRVVNNVAIAINHEEVDQDNIMSILSSASCSSSQDPGARALVIVSQSKKRPVMKIIVRKSHAYGSKHCPAMNNYCDRDLTVIVAGVGLLLFSSMLTSWDQTLIKHWSPILRLPPS